MALDDFKGKVAFVTGASTKRGMGRAIALRLAAAGADMAILDKYPAPKSLFPGDEGWRGLEEEVEEIKALGREALALTTDISNSSECNEAVKKVLEKFGRIDIFVHSAVSPGPWPIAPSTYIAKACGQRTSRRSQPRCAISPSRCFVTL